MITDINYIVQCSCMRTEYSQKHYLFTVHVQCMVNNIVQCAYTKLEPISESWILIFLANFSNFKFGLSLWSSLNWIAAVPLIACSSHLVNWKLMPLDGFVKQRSYLGRKASSLCGVLLMFYVFLIRVTVHRICNANTCLPVVTGDE